MRAPLLALLQSLPYPPHSGVANRTYNILLQLQRAFDVYVVAFSRRNHQPDGRTRDSARLQLEQRLTRVYEPAPLVGEWSRFRRVLAHVCSVASSRPYTFYEYASRKFDTSVHQGLREVRPALVHVDSLDLYRWLPLLQGVPHTVTHHSVESELLRSRAMHIGRPVVRAYLRHQASLVEAVERRLCPQIPLNVTMSDTDAEKLRAIAPGSRTVTVPNGVDVSHFTPRPDARRPNRVLFLGPTYMYPNRDAVDWFLADIWARVRAAVPAAWLDLVGKSSATDRTRYESVGQVRVHGYVDDVRPYLASATCSIAPIRIGGGTRLKILDSWSMGTAVVSTSTGCEGLHAADGENILIRDEAEGFAAAVVDVLEKEELRERLAAAGRKTVENEYSWQAIGDGLIENYRSLTEQ